MQPAAAARPSRPARLIAIGVWCFGALLGSRWQAGRFVEREHACFAVAFEAALAIGVQRLDQNEALLDGLAALLRSSRDREFPELRQYGDEMLRRHPHLYTIGHQPRVALAERAAFEQRMDERFGRRFDIRDFSFDGDRSWRVSPPRPFYFPVLFMAPEVGGCTRGDRLRRARRHTVSQRDRSFRPARPAGRDLACRSSSSGPIPTC